MNISLPGPQERSQRNPVTSSAMSNAKRLN